MHFKVIFGKFNFNGKKVNKITCWLNQTCVIHFNESDIRKCFFSVWGWFSFNRKSVIGWNWKISRKIKLNALVYNANTQQKNCEKVFFSLLLGKLFENDYRMFDFRLEIFCWACDEDESCVNVRKCEHFLDLKRFFLVAIKRGWRGPTVKA